MQPAKRLEWREPALYLQKKRQADPKKWRVRRAAFFLLAFGQVLLIRALAGINPKRPPLGWPESILLGLAAGLLLGAVIPWLVTLRKSVRVIITKQWVGFHQITGEGEFGSRSRYWKWDRIGSYRIETEQVDDWGFRVFVLLDPSGKELFRSALGDEVTPEQVELHMRSYMNPLTSS